MHIQTTTLPAKKSNTRILYESDSERSVSIAIGVKAAGHVAQAPQKSDDKVEGIVAPLLEKGVPLAATYKAGSYLVQGVSSATIPEVSNMLQQYGMVRGADHATIEAKKILNVLQSKGANSLLLGAHAGVLTFVAIDAVAPGWSVGRKVTLTAAVFALVSAFVYFGIDEPAEPSKPAQNAEGSSTAIEATITK
ncbi:MAG: hypothetical protein WBD34_23135 [Burkholderiaceae bacterium]